MAEDPSLVARVRELADLGAAGRGAPRGSGGHSRAARRAAGSDARRARHRRPRARRRAAAHCSARREPGSGPGSISSRATSGPPKSPSSARRGPLRRHRARRRLGDVPRRDHGARSRRADGRRARRADDRDRRRHGPDLDGETGSVSSSPQARTARGEEDDAPPEPARDARSRRCGPPRRHPRRPRIALLCNASTAAEIDAGLDAGAEGVGLLRTELAFLEATAWPTEEEHFERSSPRSARCAAASRRCARSTSAPTRRRPSSRGSGPRPDPDALHPTELAEQLRAIAQQAPGRSCASCSRSSSRPSRCAPFARSLRCPRADPASSSAR